MQSLYIFRRSAKITFEAVEFLFVVRVARFFFFPNINLDKKKTKSNSPVSFMRNKTFWLRE